MNFSELINGDIDEHPWELPQERTSQLIQCAIRQYLDNPQRFYQPVEIAVLRAARSLLEQHPHLADDIRANVRLHVSHWVSANTRHPGQRVTPTIGLRNTDFARDLAGHGWDAVVQEIVTSGKRAALSVWTNVVFDLTTDPDELRDYLNTITRSIFTYCEDFTTGLNTGPKQLPISDLAGLRRIKAVKDLLNGAQTDSQTVPGLNYEIEAPHSAAIIWTGQQHTGSFDDTISTLARVSGAARTLTVPASASARWLWFSAERGIDVDAFRSELKSIPDVRMAIGTHGQGLSGFRSSHLDALAAQRLMCGQCSHIQVASFVELEMISLVADNEERARGFVSRSLGNLASASYELRETLRTYLREGSSITRTAERLYAHRNTIVNRLDKIRTLLPTPLEGNVIKVGLALEISQLLGDPTGNCEAGRTNGTRG
ncbi:PucR family transcriptional regulator [Mycobacteroides abscessus]|uniref:PucR family transcriptional regulator n=1 Tax=Mycobacteroides abscessus TaxID=36809 RepID=UPI0013F5B888|nr:helix-turn-helix domain-containing protein [Mycobacteroides abscessus]